MVVTRRRPLRWLRAIAILAAVIVVAAVSIVLTRPSSKPLRIVVIADSLTEGMGEVTDLRRTWPHLVGDQLRIERGEAAGSGGTWLPASVSGPMFGFAAGRAGDGSWPAIGDSGVPGSIGHGPVSWDVSRYDSAVVQVSAEKAGQQFSASSGGTTVDFTSSAAGVSSFVVDSLGPELTVRGQGVVLGVLGRSGTGTVDVYNLAWAGSSTQDWLGWVGRPALLPLLRGIDPDVVVLSLAGNDLWQGVGAEKFAGNLRRLHELVGEVAPRARWVLGTQPVADNTPRADWMAYQQKVIDYAAELRAPLIDLVDTMPGYSGGPFFYAADHAHLTDAGHALEAGEAGPAIRRALL
ncbi:MAG: SGNH/GDSL hydrolase family protein [Micropruina sp.]|uniref:SGNH/GDSL hydrolase family protein n=1 Tax=Micropruina sp. TaxID=2737536 RepID=UPI0039E44B84